MNGTNSERIPVHHCRCHKTERVGVCVRVCASSVCRFSDEILVTPEGETKTFPLPPEEVFCTFLSEHLNVCRGRYAASESLWLLPHILAIYSLKIKRFKDTGIWQECMEVPNCQNQK